MSRIQKVFIIYTTTLSIISCFAFGILAFPIAMATFFFFTYPSS